MKVLVCGGRFYRDAAVLTQTLDNAHANKPISLLIHGAAEGADVRAALWALGHSIPVQEFPALWHKFGSRAGPIRNRQMLDEGRPDLVIAFPGGRGTAHMVHAARSRNFLVVEVGDKPALFGIARANFLWEKHRAS